MTSLIRNKRGWLPALAGLALMAGLCAPAAAYDKDLSLTAASGQSSVRKAGVILGLTRPNALWQGERWRLMLRHEFELAAWRVRHARNLVEAGYSPVLRLEHRQFQRSPDDSDAPYPDRPDRSPAMHLPSDAFRDAGRHLSRYRYLQNGSYARRTVTRINVHA